VLRLAEADPALAQRISPELPDIAAEAAYAASHEQAHTVADVLLRRTRLGLLDAHRLCEPDAEGPRVVAEAMAGQLGWNAARTECELEAWREEARAEGLVPEPAAVAQAVAGAPAGTPRAPTSSDAAAAPEEPSPTAPGAAPEEAA
jgi:glycerol-3-phosphate dehydrogenase